LGRRNQQYEMGVLTKYEFSSRPDIEGYLFAKGGKVTFHNLLYVVTGRYAGVDRKK
jgi:hypothetical protein